MCDTCHPCPEHALQIESLRSAVTSIEASLQTHRDTLRSIVNLCNALADRSIDLGLRFVNTENRVNNTENRVNDHTILLKKITSRLSNDAFLPSLRPRPSGAISPESPVDPPQPSDKPAIAPV